jgi:hypothetical protein
MAKLHHGNACWDVPYEFALELLSTFTTEQRIEAGTKG